MKIMQRGFSAITAIMLVTVLAVLTAAAIRMLRSTGNDQTLDLQSQQARVSARAGMQLGFWRITQAGSCVAATNINNLPATLARYTVSLSCVSTAYTDGVAVTRYSLQAVACNQPTGGACPNNPASNGDNYIEAVVTGECLQRGAAVQCQ